MPRKRWIKLWTQETLYGTTVKELDPAERWVWLGFLALAGDSIEPGKIQIAPGIPWTDAQLAQLLDVPISTLQTAREKMIEHNKITINSDIINITNWNKYQSEYERTRKYKSTQVSTSKPTTEPNVEKSVEKIQQKVSSITDQTRPDQKNNILPFTKVKGFPRLKKELQEEKNKIGFLVDAFKAYHAHAPPADFENLGGRLAGILKTISNDYNYLLGLIWDTRSVAIRGSHLNYIQGKIRGTKRRGRRLPTDEERERSLK